MNEPNGWVKRGKGGTVFSVGPVQVFIAAEDHPPPHVHAFHPGEGWRARFRFSFLSDIAGLYGLRMAGRRPRVRTLAELEQEIIARLDICRAQWWQTHKERSGIGLVNRRVEVTQRQNGVLVRVAQLPSRNAVAITAAAYDPALPACCSHIGEWRRAFARGRRPYRGGGGMDVTDDGAGWRLPRRRKMTETLIDAAIVAESARAACEHHAELAWYDRARDLVIIKLQDGRVFGAERARIPSLADASPHQLRGVSASADGAFIVVAAIDLHIGVDGLVGRLLEDSPASVRRLAARAAGRTHSPVKAAAAQRNGQRGGRPRKSA